MEFEINEIKREMVEMAVRLADIEGRMAACEERGWWLTVLCGSGLGLVVTTILAVLVAMIARWMGCSAPPQSRGSKPASAVETPLRGRAAELNLYEPPPSATASASLLQGRSATLELYEIPYEVPRPRLPSLPM